MFFPNLLCIDMFFSGVLTRHYRYMESVRGKVYAEKPRGRDERKLVIVVFVTLVARHLSFIPHVMPKTKKLN